MVLYQQTRSESGLILSLIYQKNMANQTPKAEQLLGFGLISGYH